VFMNAIHDLIADRPELRRDLIAPTGEARDAGAAPASVAQRIAARLDDLRALLAGLDARQLQRQWMRDAAPEGEVAAAPGGEVDAPAEIRRSTVFERVGDEPFHFLVAPAAPGGEERCFFFRGEEWSLPLSATALLTELPRHEQFRAEEALSWDGKLRFDELRTALGLLVAAGVLRQR
jgi:hypothetical protein